MRNPATFVIGLVMGTALASAGSTFADPALPSNARQAQNDDAFRREGDLTIGMSTSKVAARCGSDLLIQARHTPYDDPTVMVRCGGQAEVYDLNSLVRGWDITIPAGH
jgi:hypothetical protein